MQGMTWQPQSWLVLLVEAEENRGKREKQAGLCASGGDGNYIVKCGTLDARPDSGIL